jgi:excisionase family DNA binding protein
MHLSPAAKSAAIELLNAEARGDVGEKMQAHQAPEGRNPVVPEGSTGFLESGRQDLNLRPLGPERPPADSHALSGGTTARHPVDLVGGAEEAGSHPEAPIAYEATPFGAPVARLGRSVEDWIDPADVATRLKVGRATVYALVKSGQLHHRRVGLQIRVPLSALEEFLSASR